ncbi:uncharacterized protein LOC130442549 isoform X1 [Diorhabda sublineata]|uniref:uncharacterized protein LOC130442549 isoform X1 n=2 Tax=Diorhabda sublineata TaxID=1163346 RepID=UPI0024E09698|nr:uncharacterized protein LOC130442549 isoform X1 [Diorhabda sublineata]XP_056632718.1 uncharacterized protein LOC130442549 isoform X1 [Diorhabda sublineata]
MSESAYNSPLLTRRLTESCCSSPARSIRSHNAEDMSDSEGENEVLVTEIPGTPDQTIISGWLKFRDNKKWKQRWGVITKLSPAADCLHLQLYRDSKDRYKQGQTKASLSLEHFLGLETGFTLDKESNTVAILCQDVVVVLAFDNRERLMQWQVKLSSHLNDGPHFLVLVSSAPPKSRLPPGPARLHVQERGFCLTTGVPPRVAGQWLISNLRRYGVVEGRFCFEGGSRCIKGEGLYVLLTDQGEEITSTLKAASVGNLHSSRRRPVSRNMSVMDSPRRGPMRATGGIGLELSETSLLSRADSPYTDMESNYGCGDSISHDGWGPPPIERCMSCISKLGAMSRSSTATITVGAPPCWEHTCDRHSISSSSDSSGWSQAVTKPPARPPKPGTTSPSPKKPAAPPPPQPSYDNYDIPKMPFPVEAKGDDHYDTPRKLKECIQGFGFDTVQKPCGCIVRIRQPEPERPCVCQRLMSCWSGTEDVHAIYATIDYSKKTQRQQPVATVANYANLAPMPTVTTTAAQLTTNYENMEFAQTLQLYENSKELAEKAKSLCAKCGHAQEDYLMMEPSNKPSQPHPGYIPMSPAVKQRLGKVLSNSNPNLGPAPDRSIKPSGSSMLQGTIYQRKQLLDNVDNLDIKRRRSNSADSSTGRFEPEPEPETSPCHCTTAIAVRRSSSVPCKSNRDSSSSNDSGVFELPRKPQICANQTLPRRSKSSDPLRDLTFQFTKTETKSASAEAEVPVCPSGSTSSGTSDMSDYFETLSLSSHSSSDAPPPPSCTLRPRSGNEYLSMQRLIAPVPEERH